MTQINVTISESVRCFGVEPSNKWNTVKWSEKWGYGNVSATFSVGNSISETVTLSESTKPIISLLISESLGSADSLTGETLNDQNGYFRVINGSTNLEDRVLTSFNRSINSASSYTKQTNPSTNWTEQ